MINEKDEQIKIMTDFLQSKIFIEKMKGDMQKNLKKRSMLKAQIKYFQSFDKDEELMRICNNLDCCVNQALKCVLREKIQSQSLKPYWRVLSNINYNLNNNSYQYRNLQNIQHFPSQFQEIIKRDILRTTQNEEDRTKLSNILNAYSIRNAQIGYCQGFNYIAYYFLQHFSEEETFWFLCFLFETLLPPNYYNHLYGVQCDDFIIKDLLQFLRPQLISHMQRLQIDTSLIIIQWLVCCFTLHNRLSETIIDLLLLDGSKALIKCVLTYMSLSEPMLLKCEEIGTFIMSIENFIQSYQDREQYVKEYNRIYINNKILQFVRQEYSKKVVLMVQQRSNQSAQQLDAYLQVLKQKKCNPESPVCQYILEAWNRNKRHLDFIIIQERNIKVIQDYEQIQNRQSNLENYDQMILRQNHICQSNDIILIREIQYSDIQDVEIVNMKQTQKTNQVSKRTRSPIKDFLLFPLKVFNQKEQEQKLKMNPQKYKIEPSDSVQRMVKSVQTQQSPNSSQNSNRGRSPQQRKSQQTDDMSQNPAQIERTQKDELPKIRESITIQFLTELQKNTGLINLDLNIKDVFEQKS
ncbi:unnamed protein product [Paramecium octaurelia]|uniref:Rab-GAP TBC domain-containing protein n=1 Tax=Paramecium octaurelia TaxID=43137 RepID=A0A8S1VWB5_PAROT|nr:unnamed protein product [Paramecium octaurelia]